MGDEVLDSPSSQEVPKPERGRVKGQRLSPKKLPDPPPDISIDPAKHLAIRASVLEASIDAYKKLRDVVSPALPIHNEEVPLPPGLPAFRGSLEMPALVSPTLSINSKVNQDATLNVNNVVKEGNNLPKNVKDAVKKLNQWIPNCVDAQNVIWVVDLKGWLRANNYPQPENEYARLMAEGAAGFHVSDGGHNEKVYLIGEHPLYTRLENYDLKYSSDLFASVVSALIYHEVLHSYLTDHVQIRQKENELLDRLLARARARFRMIAPGVTQEYLAIFEGVVRDQYNRYSDLKSKQTASRN